MSLGHFLSFIVIDLLSLMVICCHFLSFQHSRHLVYVTGACMGQVGTYGTFGTFGLGNLPLDPSTPRPLDPSTPLGDTARGHRSGTKWWVGKNIFYGIYLPIDKKVVNWHRI